MAVKLVKTSAEQMGSLAYRKWERTLRDFEASDMDAAEVSEYGCDINSAYAGLKRAKQKIGSTVRVRRIAGKLFLVKEQ